jgi:glycosyltransferase involved in cell wall biosynthesis
VDAAAGGPAYSIPSLAQALAEQGAELDLHVLFGPESCGEIAYRLHRHPCWQILKKLGIAPPLRRALRTAAQQADILHNHGLWTMPNIYPRAAVRGTACKLITSPRGMLSPQALAKSRWRKRVMWLLCQQRALAASHCFHATAENEYRDIRAAGLRGPVAIIPNGIDVPPKLVREDIQRRRVLFLGRLDPIKRIDVLIQAWRQVQERFPAWDLEIVGPDENGHLQQLQKMAAEPNAQRVAFRGPAYGPAKEAALRQAQLLVLPSRSENFGMVVAEALANGVPVIVSRGAPWSAVETHRCGWWLDISVPALAEMLGKALSLSPIELAEMGKRGREWIARELDWKRIAQMMVVTYQWLIDGGEPPRCVITD